MLTIEAVIHDAAMGPAAREKRRAPAKPPAQPVGMAESDMNKSSWPKTGSH